MAPLVMIASLALGAGVAACSSERTVVVVSVPGTDGREAPVVGQVVVLLPYDRDSVIAAISAPWAAARPDTTPLALLLDTLRLAYTRYLGTPAARRPAARAVHDAALTAAADRLTRLRAEQHLWQDSAYRTYDSVTLVITERLVRDAYADTTDAEGVAVVAPSRSGPWWITVTFSSATPVCSTRSFLTAWEGTITPARRGRVSATKWRK